MKKFTIPQRKFKILVLILCCLTPLNFMFSFAYVFAGESNGLDLVTHPTGYTGAGTTLNVTVGIDPVSPNAFDMEIPTLNVIGKFNALTSTTGNISFGFIPSNVVDFESVLLHEMGHSLGLAHCNLATESGLSGDDRDYTKATVGGNGVFDLDPGVDGLIGSEDDIRGDDVNLNYFKIADNNPFTIANTVDGSTYSRFVQLLPTGALYSTNADLDVSVGAFGLSATEAAMQQGSRSGEEQRTLAADDVAGLQYAASGIDRIAGTADDYIITLNYLGFTDNADIVIAFDNSETGFAVSQSSATFLDPEHVSITSNRIYFNTNFNWFFNSTLTTPEFNSNAQELLLLPNPAKTHVSLKLSAGIEINSVEIYDVNGRLIKSLNKSSLNSLDSDIDISEFQEGIYLFKIDYNKGQLVKQIIKN